MKLKIWSILIVFVLVFFISSTGGNAYYDAQEKFSGPGLEWLLKYVEKPYTLDELNKIFRARHHRLSKFFVKDQFDKIGKYYGPGGMVRTHDNELIYGADNIANYFEELKGDVAVVSFEAVKVYIDLDEYLAKKKDGLLEDKVYTIHEIILITFDIDGHSIVELASSTSYTHSRKTFRNGE